jgi:hypothetical protein
MVTDHIRLYTDLVAGRAGGTGAQQRSHGGTQPAAGTVRTAEAAVA